MSDELIEYVVTQTGPTRRQFMTRLLMGAAFAAPVVASFGIGHGSSATRTPAGALPDTAANTTIGGNIIVDEVIDLGANLPDCGPNTTDYGANSDPLYFDEAANTYCQMPVDDGSNSVDEGSNTGDSGSGAGIPPSK